MEYLELVVRALKVAKVKVEYPVYLVGTVLRESLVILDYRVLKE